MLRRTPTANLPILAPGVFLYFLLFVLMYINVLTWLRRPTYQLDRTGLPALYLDQALRPEPAWSGVNASCRSAPSWGSPNRYATFFAILRGSRGFWLRERGSRPSEEQRGSTQESEPKKFYPNSYYILFSKTRKPGGVQCTNTKHLF